MHNKKHPPSETEGVFVLSLYYELAATTGRDQTTEAQQSRGARGGHCVELERLVAADAAAGANGDVFAAHGRDVTSAVQEPATKHWSGGDDFHRASAGNGEDRVIARGQRTERDRPDEVAGGGQRHGARASEHVCGVVEVEGERVTSGRNAADEDELREQERRT